MGSDHDYDALVDLVGEARFVLLGEASHGTDEFYRERARMTQRLIAEKGFSAVAVEADWPDAHRVNCFVQGAGDDATAEAALRGFQRFPTWMWRNTVVVDFVDWLGARNDGVGRRDQVGFYGLDLYSLHTSMDAVIGYLDGVDPEAATRARERYSCFDHAAADARDYARAAAFGAGQSCEDQVVAQLADLCRHAADYAQMDGQVAEDELFYAERNARLVANAEEYYRTMFGSRVQSWNLRDRHMAETLDALADHLSRRRGRPAKIVVWEHNSHLGDARATEMGDRGELNVGQLVREGHGAEAVLVGFTTHSGTVTAADDWGGPTRRKQVRRALTGSYEELFHQVGTGRFLLALRGGGEAAEALRVPRLERAVGVIYRPRTERASHYFQARLSDQFDAVVHLDATTAVEPLERGAGWDQPDAPETYPLEV